MQEGIFFPVEIVSTINLSLMNCLNADFLEEVNAQYSFTTDRIQREISHAPDEVQLVVDTEDDANLEDLELLTTRRSMWIPTSMPPCSWKPVFPLSPSGIAFTHNYS